MTIRTTNSISATTNSGWVSSIHILIPIISIGTIIQCYQSLTFANGDFSHRSADARIVAGKGSGMIDDDENTYEQKHSDNNTSYCFFI